MTTHRDPWSIQFAALAAIAVSCAQLHAQQDATALADKVEKDVATALLARADALSSVQQHGRATELRRAVLQDWSPGDERALPPLGFVKVGDAWRRDANKAVPDVDQKGDAKALKKIEQEWTKTEKDLVKQLEAAAKALVADGKAERSTLFYKRVLWFRPSDKAALAAIAGATFDGFTGTPSELAMLRRGRAFAQAVEFLRAYEPEVTPLQEPNELLQKAGVAHAGLRTAHFRVYGAIAPEKLRLAAMTAERAWLLSRLLLANANGERFEPRKRYDIVWTAERSAYKKILDAAKSEFTPERLRFLQEDVDLAFVQVGSEHQRLYTVAQGTGDDFLQDVTARGVVQDAAGIDLHGLWEGVGHATVGVLFDRTLSFFVEQPQGSTVTSWKPKPLMPDMESWRLIAAESAWAKNDTPTARLVLLQGDKLSNEERVKAWAMCDFMMRTDPGLLLDLAACKTTEVRDPDAVMAAFEKRTGRTLLSIDDAWRSYWGSGQALRKAMAQPPSGKKEEVQDARLLAQAILRARARADACPGGFVLANSAESQSVHAYFVAKEKWEQEQKRAKAAAKGAPLPPSQPPVPPSAIGATVAVHEGTDADAAVRAWLGDPALRDFLLDPGRSMWAVGKGKHACVLELFHPVEPLKRGTPIVWPVDGAKGIPSAHAGAGMPVSLHFHRDVDLGLLQQVSCVVRAGGQQVTGSLVVLQGEAARGARGCVAFVPTSPLPAGECEVAWSVPLQLIGGKGATQPKARFVVE